MNRFQLNSDFKAEVPAWDFEDRRCYLVALLPDRLSARDFRNSLKKRTKRTQRRKRRLNALIIAIVGQVKGIYLAITVAVASLAIWGCAKKSMVGTWKFKDIHLTPEGQLSLNRSGVPVSGLKQQYVGSTIRFKDPSHFELTGRATWGGTYSVNGESVVLHIDSFNGANMAQLLENARERFKGHPEILNRFSQKSLDLRANLDGGGTLLEVENPGGVGIISEFFKPN